MGDTIAQLAEEQADKYEQQERERRPWLVWSNQHGMWWRGGERGYTRYIEEAGRYTHAAAAAIVARATCDGQLQRHREDPYTGVEYIGLDEVMVPSP